MGSGKRRVHRRYERRIDDRRAGGRGSSALVHGCAFARRVLRGPPGAGRAPGGARRPRGGRGVSPPPRAAADRPRLAAHGADCAVEAASPHAGPADGGLDSQRLHLDRVAQGGRGTSRARGLGRASELLGGRLRLRERQARAVRALRLPARADRRRGRGLLCDSGLLPARQDRRAPLRGRRRLLALEPRPRCRTRARSRDLPQPDVVELRARRARAARLGGGRDPALGRPAPRARGAQGAPLRHRGAHDRADARGSRCHGAQLDERRAPPPGDRDRRADGARAAAPPRRAGAAAQDCRAGEPHKVRRPEGPPSTWPLLATPAHRAA